MSGVKRSAIDWAAVRRRLRASEESLARAASMDLAAAEARLRDRARSLAERAPSEEESTNLIDVLVFRVGSERFGVVLSALKEVLRRPRVTPVPGSPAELLGIVNFRGELRPVIDLGRLLDLPAGEPASSLLLVRRGTLEVALAVQGMESVQSVATNDVRPLDGRSGWTTRLVEGLLPGRLPLLDIEALLSHSVFKEANDS